MVKSNYNTENHILAYCLLYDINGSTKLHRSGHVLGGTLSQIQAP
jgi:hypothetical protein